MAKRLTQVLFVLVLYAVLLFAGAGRIGWTWAWVYVAACVAILCVNAVVMPADLIAERGRKKENVEPWDRRLTTVAAVPYVALPLAAGLDERLGGSPAMPVAVHVAALALFVASQVLVTWAMVSNRFFSTAVRMQFDRGHVVATGGPYAWVRHPGYLGMIIGMFAVPLLLGSLWALIPGALYAALLVLRTILEDRTLRAELPGYEDYAKRVHYRLLPGLW